MQKTFNIYCDESCHLENDRANDSAMVIGGVWCPAERKDEIFRSIRDIKERHGIRRDVEIKWNKVSPAQREYYLDLVNYFFDDPDLHFRAVVVDKRSLHHDDFQQSHDDFYYKTYFRMLKTILEPGNEYSIYIDIKDTRSQKKVEKLHEVLSNSNYDFNRQMIRKIQQVRSKDVELVGLADLLIGALSYLHRGLEGSATKLEIIDLCRRRSGYSLLSSTLYREYKFNLFVWRG